jgi:hypothetical protein
MWKTTSLVHVSEFAQLNSDEERIEYRDQMISSVHAKKDELMSQGLGGHSAAPWTPTLQYNKQTPKIVRYWTTEAAALTFADYANTFTPFSSTTVDGEVEEVPDDLLTD